MEIRRAPAGAGLPDMAPVREPAFRIVPDTDSQQTPAARARLPDMATVRSTAHDRHPLAVHEPEAGSALLQIRAATALPRSPRPERLFRPLRTPPPVTPASRRAPAAVAPCRGGPRIRARND
ncbi:hypothetical protein AB0D09_13545 [Streptomyces sp. NPDC049097]|uniref:hypothetical protein n=1 Tax=unclassified Streptomyces TaxID=2593676 RepID=UPI0033F503B0